MGCWGTRAQRGEIAGGSGRSPQGEPEKGTAGIRGMAGKAGDRQRAREKLQKWAHPGLKQGVGLQPGSSEEDANVGKKARGVVHRVGQGERPWGHGNQLGTWCNSPGLTKGTWQDGHWRACPAAGGMEGAESIDFPACTARWEWCHPPREETRCR